MPRARKTTKIKNKNKNEHPDQQWSTNKRRFLFSFYLFQVLNTIIEIDLGTREMDFVQNVSHFNFLISKSCGISSSSYSNEGTNSI